LGVANTSDACNKLDDDEKTTIVKTDSGGIPVTYLVVTEPGLYKLIARSRKPEAKAFDRWVRDEVLPTIRKTGSYQAHYDGPPTWLSAVMTAVASVTQSFATLVAKDVCEALGIARESALGKLDADEKGVTQLVTPGGEQQVAVVTEPGLYKLIARSRIPRQAPSHSTPRAF
jgi:prophage antirepressor-like protein